MLKQRWDLWSEESLFSACILPIILSFEIRLSTGKMIHLEARLGKFSCSQFQPKEYPLSQSLSFLVTLPFWTPLMTAPQSIRTRLTWSWGMRRWDGEGHARKPRTPLAERSVDGTVISSSFCVIRGLGRSCKELFEGCRENSKTSLTTPVQNNTHQTTTIWQFNLGKGVFGSIHPSVRPSIHPPVLKPPIYIVAQGLRPSSWKRNWVQSFGTKAPAQQNEGPEKMATHFLLFHRGCLEH